LKVVLNNINQTKPAYSFFVPMRLQWVFLRIKLSCVVFCLRNGVG